MEEFSSSKEVSLSSVLDWFGDDAGNPHITSFVSSGDSTQKIAIIVEHTTHSTLNTCKYIWMQNNWRKLTTLTTMFLHEFYERAHGIPDQGFWLQKRQLSQLQKTLLKTR